MFCTRRKTERACGMEISGDGEFRRQTLQALSLLQPLAEFALIQFHLKVIRQGRRSGVTAWAERPVFTVGAPTWSHSPVWFAGAIAHDAYHAKLYRTAKQRTGKGKLNVERWSGKTAERACLLFQRKVLLRLHADASVLNHVEMHLRDANYQGRIKGVAGWLDYRKRWW
jgi:hypothetical protein